MTPATNYPARFAEQNDAPPDPAKVAQQVSAVIQIDRPQGDAARTIQYGGFNGNMYGGGYACTSTETAEFAVALGTSSKVIDIASAAALNLSPQQRLASVHVQATTVGPKLVRLEVDLLKGDTAFAEGDAQKLFTKLCDHIIGGFAQSEAASQTAIDAQAIQDAKDKDDIAKQIADVRVKLRADQEKTLTNASMYGDPTNSITNLRSQRQYAVTELDRNKARLAQIDASSTSSIVSQWEALVTQYQQQLQEVTAAPTAAKATDDQVREAQGRLTDAQSHLLTAKQQSDSSNDGNRVYRSQEATNLKTTIADEEARLKQTDDTIAKLSGPAFLAALDEQRSLQTTEAALLNRSSELQTRIATRPTLSPDTSKVTLTVLDGKLK